MVDHHKHRQKEKKGVDERRHHLRFDKPEGVAECGFSRTQNKGDVGDADRHHIGGVMQGIGDEGKGVCKESEKHLRNDDGKVKEDDPKYFFCFHRGHCN